MHEKLLALRNEGADPEDKNEYIAEKVFFVPEIARWKYIQGRFQNFELVLISLLEIADKTDAQDDVTVDAAIKRFEITFDLAWKVMQDYLFEQGYVEYKGPKKVIAKSFQDGIIEDGEEWAQLHEDRNILSHQYDYDKSRIIYERIIALHVPLLSNFKKN